MSPSVDESAMQGTTALHPGGSETSEKSTALDTSGEVLVQRASSGGPFATCWGDLAPFTQGYVEAMFVSARTTTNLIWDYNDQGRLPGFADLAPETLARIMADCAAYSAIAERACADAGIEFKAAYEGRMLWIERTADERQAFPPLTPYLGDDGRVYLRVALPEPPHE